MRSQWIFDKPDTEADKTFRSVINNMGNVSLFDAIYPDVFKEAEKILESEDDDESQD